MVERRRKCRGNSSVLVIGSSKRTYTNWGKTLIVVSYMRWKEVMDKGS